MENLEHLENLEDLGDAVPLSLPCPKCEGRFETVDGLFEHAKLHVLAAQAPNPSCLSEATTPTPSEVSLVDLTDEVPLLSRRRRWDRSSVPLGFRPIDVRSNVYPFSQETLSFFKEEILHEERGMTDRDLKEFLEKEYRVSKEAEDLLKIQEVNPELKGLDSGSSMAFLDTMHKTVRLVTRPLMATWQAVESSKDLRELPLNAEVILKEAENLELSPSF
ncbi:Hypothetical protein FKW44_000046 [Caligus rogercresseyi]|uniref:C2H2-type domain-containing protein n=1 Tax=Caligus rogercresseyi TaxID=217165 RepID=A0A7T8KGR6_CALRO|nr:Hypothetical protein FKW44_000046 [Caligus rogercresseyi]